MGAEPDQDGGRLLAGRYEVGPLVGLGGTARVYRAWDHRDRRAVAVKVFRPGSTPSPGDGGARELTVLGGVSHPGVVGVQACGVDGEGCPFVVMDFVDGRSLAARLQDGPLRVDEATRLGVVLADALAVVHARGVVHRDVKPANVLLDTDGRPWLTDFGIARIVDATRVTATGIVVGTAAYMAPEQVRGETVGPPADVYALGLVLLEALTGRREYEGNALESALARLHRAPVVPPTVPDLLADLVMRMTALDPDARPVASDVAAALRAPATGPHRAARRAAPVAALACLVTGALAGVLALTGAQAPAEAPAAAAVVAVPPVVPPTVVAAEASPEAAVTAAEPPPAPVAVTRGKSTPTPGRSAPVAPRPPAARADGSDDGGDGSGDDHARQGGDRRGNDTRNDDRGDDGDHGSKAHDDGGDKGDRGDDGDRGGKGKGDRGKKDDGGGHGGGGRSGSHSGKG